MSRLDDSLATSAAIEAATRDAESATDGSRVSAGGRVLVSRRYKDKEIIDPKDVDEMIEVGFYPTGVPIASVSYSCTMTLNLGNYESVKLFVSVTLPTPIEELSDAWEAAKAFADSRLNAECADIRKYRAEKEEGLDTEGR